MATLGFNLPRISDSNSSNKEIKEVKEYLYQLTEQLRYVLMNLDTDNFNDGFSNTIADEIKNTVSAQTANVRGLQGSLAALRVSVNTAKGDITAISARVLDAETDIAGLDGRMDTLEAVVTETGTVDITAGTDAVVTFAKTFSAAPVVVIGYNGAGDAAEWAAVSAHTVTAAGFRASINGTSPISATAAWVAVGT